MPVDARRVAAIASELVEILSSHTDRCATVLLATQSDRPDDGRVALTLS